MQYGCFDKTGTITSGKFEYVNCECVHCHCENTSEHKRASLQLLQPVKDIQRIRLQKSICLAFGHYADALKVEDAKELCGNGCFCCC